MSLLVLAAGKENRDYFTDCLGFCWSNYFNSKFEKKITDLTNASITDNWHINERAEGIYNLVEQTGYFTLRLASRIGVLITRYFTMIAVTLGAPFSERCRELFVPSFIRLFITHGRLIGGKFQIALVIIGSLAQILSPTTGMKILKACHEIDSDFDLYELNAYKKFEETKRENIKNHWEGFSKFKN